MIDKADLSNCDREPIHIVGSIQPQGVFAAFRLNDQTVYHVSENFSAWFQTDSVNAIGKRLAQVLGSEIADAILTAAPNVAPLRPQYLKCRNPDDLNQTYEIYVYELQGLIGVEIELQSGSSHSKVSELSESHRRSQSFIEELHAGESLSSIAVMTCKAIRAYTGFDRVMMYRYLPSWDGEVIAEDKSAEAHSFMSHRFPASDIPLPARELYLKNRSRLIADSAAKPVPILRQDHYLTHKPIDLSYSKLRAVSPIHLQYLQNMGVKSSLSFAVIVAGELWGLIACHAAEMTIPSFEVRLECETIASTFAALANMKERLTEQSKKIEFENGLRSLFAHVIQKPNLISALIELHPEILKIFDASGIALVSDERTAIAGLTPPESMTKELADDLRGLLKSENKTVLAVASLTELDPKYAGFSEICCGALVTYSPSSSNALFIIFRPEALRTIVWGGDPRKNLEKRNYKGEINPRESFASWNQTVSGRSKPWQAFEVRGAEFLRDFVFNNLVKKERLIEELGQKLRIN